MNPAATACHATCEYVTYSGSYMCALNTITKTPGFEAIIAHAELAPLHINIDGER